MYVTRACDTCKRRKVKCDAADPCANCKTSRLACGYTIVPRKRGRAVRKRRLEDGDVVLPDTSPGIASPGVPSPASLTPGQLVSARSPSSIHSPAALASPGPFLPVSYGAYDAALDPICICTNLVLHFDSLMTGESIQDVASKCIDLWMTFIYPVTPTGHEPTLRASLSVFAWEGRPAAVGPASLLTHGSPQLAYMTSFTLITALCALVTSTVPDSFIPLKASLVGPFLQASRAMLSSYESHDLEHPVSSSLIIRAWHASAMQNTSGKHGAACQTHMGAELLALRLRLYEETSVVKHDVLEAQQLRSIFWLLHHSDKASAAFASRIYILDENNFDGNMTVLEYGDLAAAPHLDITRKRNQPALDHHIHAAFHQKRRMWVIAADLITAVKASKSPQTAGSSPDTIKTDNIEHLAGMYLAFTGSMAGVPPWLDLPGQDAAEPDADVARYREGTSWAMRSNMMTSFHCLKLIILQQCAARGLHGVMGLDGSDFSVGMRKIDIAQEFLYELQSVPFDGFKMQGEPAVQRIRQVGSILLELVQNASSEAIKARARAQFRQLLDYLAKLDSKVSDDLG